jgi:hypothetical protein
MRPQVYGVFVKIMVLLRGFMMKIKKIPLLVLILAVMLSTGGPCVFPMLTAQASSGMMDMSNQSPVDEQDNGIMGTDSSMNSMVHLPLTQSHVKNCSLECGQTKDNVGTIKKSQEILQLPNLALQGVFIAPSLVDGLNIEAFEPPEILPLQDLILTVAKKE